MILIMKCFAGYRASKPNEREEALDMKKSIDTKVDSFKLDNEGKRVEEIAEERNLRQQTIEGHLAHYVSIGEINISEVISREKVLLIEPVAKTFSGES